MAPTTSRFSWQNWVAIKQKHLNTSRCSVLKSGVEEKCSGGIMKLHSLCALFSLSHMVAREV